jgi:hypothetical protein
LPALVSDDPIANALNVHLQIPSPVLAAAVAAAFAALEADYRIDTVQEQKSAMGNKVSGFSTASRTR